MTIDDWRKIFVGNVYKRLGELDMSQKELARLIGIHEVTVSGYLNRRYAPRADVINNMAKALKCSVSDLIEVDEYIDL